MPPKKASSKKSSTKVSASVDAEVLNNGEKKVAELAIDIKNLPNGSELDEVEDAAPKSKAAKRGGGRAKNVDTVLETEAPIKKPATKGRGKKKSNENEVIENISQESEETPKKENEELITKPKGRGGGVNSKKTGANTKKSSKAKEADNIATESVAEDQDDEAKEPEKKAKASVGRKKKQEIASKPVMEIEIEEELELKVEEEKVSKKSNRNTKKTTEVIEEIEPPKKKGRSIKKAKPVEKDEEEMAATEEITVEEEVKEKKATKRGKGTAKTVIETQEEAAANGDAEEVLPKKRSRKAPSVEKEIVKDKPKRGRAKKADKLEEKVVEDDAPAQGKEEGEVENATNGQIKLDNIEETEESPSSNKNNEYQTNTAAVVTKGKGGRKRAAPSANNKKSDKSKADKGDDNQELDDGVDNAELEDEADGSKSSKTKKSKTDKAPLNSTATKYNKEDFDLPPPSDGQTFEEPRFNLKISSWNVAGLRSWLKKEGLKFLEYEQPDIFCMQEIKCTIDQLPEEVERIPGYHPYWLCMPGGYAGVAIYSKTMPINVEYGIGSKEFDDSGRLITAEYEKFFLINVYVPNSGRKLVNLEARMKWEKLFQQFVQNLDARKPVIICGDMNVSHQEHDLANPKTNTRSAGFTKEERNKMSELLALGYVDSFRHLYPERKGAYTFWTYMGNARSRNVGWRLDYFIVSERFIKRVVDNCIRSQCMGSDHCPITLFLKL